MDKIEKVYQILKNRLPEILIVPIEIYPTTIDMLIKDSKEREEPLEDAINYYNEDYKQENYIDTPYCTHVVNKHKINAFNINMLASYPIMVSRENVECRPEHEIAFLLLHEFGHIINRTIHRYFDEKLADKFAIQWLELLIKEGLIKYDK
jgi:Zn-dependent protease with chaperone function